MFEIRTLAPGEKVKEPGLYAGIPIDLYHGDVTDGPSFSKSGLAILESKTPKHYWDQSYLNPNRTPPESKAHFNFGQAAHTLFLSEAGFAEKFAVRPEKWKDWRTKEAGAWRAEQELAGRTVLVPDDLDALRGIGRSLAAEPLVQQGILHGLVEHSLFWRDKKTGIWLKARPDIIPSADGIVVDIKTTTDASPEAIERAVASLSYDMQGALIGMGLREVLGLEMTDFVLLWIEKDPPHAVNLSPVDSEWLYWGARRLRRAIDIAAKCIETGHWPGYQSEVPTSMPPWLRARYERDDKNGMFPAEA